MKKQAGLILIFLVLAHFGTLPAAARVSLRQAGTQSDKASLGIKLSDRAESRVDKGDAPSATDSILRLWLSPQTISNNKPISNTFYFWTSVVELDSVALQHRLLRTVVQSDHLVNVYQHNLIREENDLVADHLMHGYMQRVRSAWPCYWSQLAEWQPYGDDQLVQVVLNDSAIIAAYAPDGDKKLRWTFYDLKGNTIARDDAMRRKWQIAAVFISGRNKDVITAPRRYPLKEYYRGFILCNEAMIKSWHHAVPGMQARIISDLDYLLLLNAYFEDPSHEELQGKKGKNCRTAWTMLSTQMKISQLFFATQRFAWMTGVTATQESAKKIIETLRERWPKQKNPVEKFPGGR